MYLGNLPIINGILCSDTIQDSMGSIKERVGINVMGGFEPFGFEDSPQSLGNVEMWRIRRKKEDIETSLFPFINRFLHSAPGVDTGIVKNNECRSLNCFGKVIYELCYILSLYTLTACKTVIYIIAVNHTKDVKPGRFHGWHKDILSGKLPSIRDISLCANMAFVSKEKVNKSLITQIFKFLQLLALNRIEVRRGIHPWAFWDTLISCARTSKKRLNVISLTFFPEDASQRFFAAFTLCLSCETAFRTSASSEQSIIGLRPCPGFVFSPAIPSERYLFVQLKTEGSATSSCCETSAFDKFLFLRRIARQRTRNLWSDPFLYPASNASRSSSDNIICFFLAMTVCIRMSYHNITK